MPTYEYACRECGEHLEVVQSFRDDPLSTCGTCGGSLRKVFSPAGIIFKGSGYYVTDTRAERRRAASGNGSTSDKDAAGKDTTSGDGSSSGSDGGSSSSSGSDGGSSSSSSSESSSESAA